MANIAEIAHAFLTQSHAARMEMRGWSARFIQSVVVKGACLSMNTIF